MKPIRAIIADDEEALRSHLRKRLAALWPDLEIAGEARDGEAALALIRDLRPDVAFLDISMPGLSGVDVARKASGACLFVFITAHDEYAVEAFERSAVDYLLKPVVDERLKTTIRRLQERLASKSLPDITGLLERLATGMAKPAGHLQWIKAEQKDTVRLVSVNDVYFFRAEDKYIIVRTKEGELLIRKSIKDLEEELDPGQFWRVHRAALVNARLIHGVSKSIAGTLTIRFKDLPDQVTVSRAYAHLFKQM
ncbi:MAG: LytTR family DNA-binding domain-containing protein [Nitrospiraceae bacterium]|nr:LytTR family DNA-binding domain-containing protein [Nitrospiraceae bacterium]